MPAATAALWTTGASSNWSSGTYRYDGAGNYAYDGASRLTRATTLTGQSGGGSTYTRAYTYDPFANLKQIQAIPAFTGQNPPPGRSIPVSAATNRLTSASYDAAGNVTSWNGTSFEYDALGMVEKRIDSSGGQRLFFYTADDERFWSYHASGSRWTIRDLDGKVLRDYRSGVGGWSVERDYVHADGKLLAAVRPSPFEIHHYHLDHLGTPRLITNRLGGQVAYHAYFPYGEEATWWNQDTEAMKFTGHERDFYDSGPGDDLDYQHARYYGPLLGRYLSTDRLLRISRAKKKPQLWNLYSYVAGNPLAFTDPTGLYLVVPGAESIEDAQNEIEAFQAALEEIGENEIAEAIQAEVVDGEVRITAGGADINTSSTLTSRLIGSLIKTPVRITVQLTNRDLSKWGGARTDSNAPGGAIGILLNPDQIANTRVQGRFTGGRFAGISGPIGVSLGTALVHELGHAAGYIDKTRMTDTNSDALFYENQHRKLLTTTWTQTERTAH
jgi:RHS repeat-associated protein